MQYERFLNAISLERQHSPIRLASADAATCLDPDFITLAPGNPSPSLFPFKTAEFQLSDGSFLRLNEERMNVALQYGATAGNSDLLDLLRELVIKYHAPPTAKQSPENGGLDVIVTVGANDAISMIVEMLIERGDDILMQEPTFSGSLGAAAPLGPNIIGIEADGDGIIPNTLRSVLLRYEAHRIRPAKSSTPKFLYTIPTGSNPDGATLSLERKKEIYQIAREYDMLILEDDPYYFLQFSETRIPSFLSMDEDGRVLRLDSLSKIIAPGLRLGFLSGPQKLIDRILVHQMSAVLNSSLLSQVMVNDLLMQWGTEKFEQHIQSVADYYRKQRDLTLEAATKWLTGLAEWNVPAAGMFLWMKVLGLNDTRNLVEKAREKNVSIIAGFAFMINQNDPSPYIRVSFSCATPEQIDLGFQRIAESITEELNEIRQLAD